MARRKKKVGFLMKLERGFENIGPSIMGAGAASVAFTGGAALPVVAGVGVAGVVAGGLMADKKLDARQKIRDKANRLRNIKQRKSIKLRFAREARKRRSK